MEYENTDRLFQRQDPGGLAARGVAVQGQAGQGRGDTAKAEAELRFATISAPFDGIVDRLQEQQGSLIKEGDNLTTLSDNSVMWVYFNVPEKRYLEYMAEVGQDKQSPDIELRLANLNKYPLTGKIDPAHNIGAIEAQFNNETGNIAFRADFQNPRTAPAPRTARPAPW